MGHWLEEILGGEQRKGIKTTELQQPHSTNIRSINVTTESRENPFEPDPTHKKRLLMKSASSAASGSEQQRVRKSATYA